MIEADNGVIDDGSANEVTDPIEPVIDESIDGIVNESDGAMVAEYEAENEITYYDQQDQDNFKANLLTGDANAHALFNHIESTDFLNSDGSFSDRTIELAKANNMTDAEIAKHQDSVYKQMEDVRTKAFEATGFSAGYMTTVMDWCRSTFTKTEMDIFMKDCQTDLTGSLQSAERYYIDITVNGVAR